MPHFARNILAWVMIAFLLASIYQYFNPEAGGANSQNLPYSELLAQADKGLVKDATLRGDNINGTLTSGAKFHTLQPQNANVADRLAKKGVLVNVKPLETASGGLFGLLLSWFPMLLLIGVWVFFMRQMQNRNGGGGGAFGFGKSRAKMLTEKTGKVVFDDVAGIEEAKEELQEIVDFLKDPHKFQRLGGKIPKGALLVGPPGTGKTLVARAVAGEAGVPFFTISGSDFVEMFVGVGASRVRDMFEQGKKNAPCIIFIDEIDAVGRHRGMGMGGGNDEREQTLNQLLVEMDGFESSEGVILLAATNRPDVLDPALLRPGRFDRQIQVPVPDLVGREKILKVHAKKVPLADGVDLKTLARGTPGFSGADLANLVNEAALLAARQNLKHVTMQCFEKAKDKVMMGAERKSMVMSDDEKKLTAYHEAGHAVIALHEPASDPIHKATIIPRGRALGMVMRLPERDRVSLSFEKLQADLAVSMGGRVAEEMIFGASKVTTGASSDIQMATSMAKRMVADWGMSTKLGPIKYSTDNDDGYYNPNKAISDQTAQLVDAETKRFVDEAYNRARAILTAQLDKLHAIAQALLEFETLNGDELRALYAGEKLARAEAQAAEMKKPEAPKGSII